MPIRAGRGSIALLTLLVAASGCQHSEPLPSGPPTASSTPFEQSEPLRLTLSASDDLAPSWLPDGSGLLYSFVEPSHPRNDRCIGILPVTGGQLRDLRCATNDIAGDSIDALGEPSMGPNGRIAWVEQHSLIDHLTPDHSAVMVGDLTALHPATVIGRLPFISTSGSVSVTATHLRWISPTRITYVASDFLIRATCTFCRKDTLVVGREILVHDLTTGQRTVVSETGAATSVWPTADSSGIYFTRGGDTRVWRKALDGSLATVVFDFGAAGIVRDVSVVGDRLAAIVGGKVTYGPDESLATLQVDSGGVVTTVNLRNSAMETHANSGLFRHAILSPDGKQLLAEEIGPVIGPDIWLFRLPE